MYSKVTSTDKIIMKLIYLVCVCVCVKGVQEMNEAAVRMEQPLRINTECTQTKSDRVIKRNV